MSIEKTVSEIAEILGVSRQAVNNRVKQLPEEDLEKNAKGVTVVKRSGLIKLEEIYKKTIFDDEPIDEETKQRELLEILVDEKNSEIARLYAQLKAKDEQLSNMDDQLRVKDVQIAEKDKQIDQQQQARRFNIVAFVQFKLLGQLRSKLLRAQWNRQRSQLRQTSLLILGSGQRRRILGGPRKNKVIALPMRL